VLPTFVLTVEMLPPAAHAAAVTVLTEKFNSSVSLVIEGFSPPKTTAVF